jgi:hypothetical protein
MPETTTLRQQVQDAADAIATAREAYQRAVEALEAIVQDEEIRNSFAVYREAGSLACFFRYDNEGDGFNWDCALGEMADLVALTDAVIAYEDGADVIHGGRDAG